MKLGMQIRALIKALGGPTEVAAALGLRIATVSNWSMRDQIPRDHHLAVWRLATELNVAWTPPDAAGLVLALAPSQQAPPTAGSKQPVAAPKSQAKRPAPVRSREVA